MWTNYSILKSTLKVHKGIDISKYGKLTSYLKAGSRNISQRRLILKRNQIEEFLGKKPRMRNIYKLRLQRSYGSRRCNELTFLQAVTCTYSGYENKNFKKFHDRGTSFFNQCCKNVSKIHQSAT